MSETPVKPDFSTVFGDYTDKLKVLYKCPRCKITFRLLEEAEHFCHNCGQPLCWNVITRLTELKTRNYSVGLLKTLRSHGEIPKHVEELLQVGDTREENIYQPYEVKFSDFESLVDIVEKKGEEK